MSKEIEALKNMLGNIDVNTMYDYSGMSNKDYELIKQVLLKAQEQAKENAKYKKAFNIIWEKPEQSKATIVYIRATIRPTYEDYCLVIRDEYHLTQEEFDLLKEMIKNG